MSTNLKYVNLTRADQTKGLLHTGSKQQTDDRDLGFVGEYHDTNHNKTFYSGLVRSTLANDNRFILFDKLENNPFTTEQTDFTSATLEVDNIITSGSLQFQNTVPIDPYDSNIINPPIPVGSFEISAVSKMDILDAINTYGSNYLSHLFDNPNISDGNYVLIKDQVDKRDNGIYIFKNSSSSSLQKFNDNQTATYYNAPVSVVMDLTDDTKLVRYLKSPTETLYYKVHAYNQTTSDLYVEFTPYSGSANTVYQNGVWNLDGDVKISGNLTVDKSAYITKNLYLKQGLYLSILTLTSTVSGNVFDIESLYACIYRCDTTSYRMTVKLPDATHHPGRTIKFIKVHANNYVDIVPLAFQRINNVSNDMIRIKDCGEHFEIISDGEHWFIF